MTQYNDIIIVNFEHYCLLIKRNRKTSEAAQSAEQRVFLGGFEERESAVWSGQVDIRQLVSQIIRVQYAAARNFFPSTACHVIQPSRPALFRAYRVKYLVLGSALDKYAARRVSIQRIYHAFSYDWQ